jgi:hypothetical protein
LILKEVYNLFLSFLIEVPSFFCIHCTALFSTIPIIYGRIYVRFLPMSPLLPLCFSHACSSINSDIAKIPLSI